MKTARKTIWITVETATDGMGCGWRDAKIANLVYAAWLELRLREWGSDGQNFIVLTPECGHNTPKVVGDCNHEAVAEEVHQFCQDSFAEFCAIAHEQFPELCE